MMLKFVALLGFLTFVMGEPPRYAESDSVFSRLLGELRRTFQKRESSDKYRKRDDPACPSDHKCEFGSCGTAEPDPGLSYHCSCGQGVGGQFCTKPNVCGSKPCKKSAEGDSCLALNTEKGYMCFNYKRFLRMLRFIDDGIHKRHLQQLGLLDGF